jgi:flagellar hook-associated protein 3 FlgL
MRITNQMMTSGAIRHIQENQEAMKKLQDRIASGKNFEKSSDDPVGSSISMGLRSSVRNIQSYLDGNTVTSDWMNATDFSFQEMESVANRAISLVQRGLNDTLGSSERANAIAPEMDALLTQALAIGNSTSNGQFIFSGYQVNTAAFSTTVTVGPTGNSVTTVNYDGDNGLMQRSLAPNQSVTVNVRGDQAFQDFMQTIVTARDALQTNNMASLRTALSGLQSGLTTMDQYRTSHGARLRQVQTATEYLEKAQLEAKSLLSKKEDINLAEAIATLKGQENSYQAVLEVSQRAISATSLFDMLS